VLQVHCRAAVGCPEDSLRRHLRGRRHTVGLETVATVNGTWPRSPDSGGCRRSEVHIRFTCATAEGRTIAT